MFHDDEQPEADFVAYQIDGQRLHLELSAFLPVPKEILTSLFVVTPERELRRLAVKKVLMWRFQGTNYVPRHLQPGYRP